MNGNFSPAGLLLFSAEKRYFNGKKMLQRENPFGMGLAIYNTVIAAPPSSRRAATTTGSGRISAGIPDC